MKVQELKRLLTDRGIGFPSKATKAELVELLEQEDQPIEVEAVTVDEEIIPRNFLSIDAEAMQAAALELTAAMDEAATALGEFDVDDAEIDAMGIADIKVCEGGIASAINDVDEKRKALTKMLTEPKKAIDEKVKELTVPLEALKGRYADARQAVLEKGYRAQYEDCCIANGMDKLAQVVPYDKFIAGHKQWVSRTANPLKTQEKIADEVARIAKDWEALRGLRGSMRFYDEAEACFFDTLDLNAAITRNKERTAQQQKIDAMNAEREEVERWRREQEAQRAQEPPRMPVFTEVEPEPAPIQEPPANAVMAREAAFPEAPMEAAPAVNALRADGRRRYHFEAWLNDAELASFREWKNACGVGDGWTYREVRNG